MSRQLYFLIPGDPDSATGGYVYDRRIAAALRELGWQVDVLRLDASFPFPTAAALAAAHAILQQLPDDACVLIDGLALGAMPQLLQPQAARLRLVALIHHPLAAETGLSSAAAASLQQSERLALQTVRAVVVTSPATAATLGDYGVGPERIAVVVPGTDPAPAALARHSIATPLELLCVATVTPRKGHDLLIEALAPLRQFDWRLNCVGSLARSRDTARALREQIEACGLSGHVTLAGELTDDELEACYARAHLFVLPTRYEGYGMVVAEALARSLPVIGTDTGAIAQLVPVDAGIVVPPADARALQRALARVFEEPALLATLAAGAAAARHGLQRWPDSAQRLSGLLLEVGR